MDYINFEETMELLKYAEYWITKLTFEKIWKDERLCNHLWDKKEKSANIIDFWCHLDPVNKKKFYFGLKDEFKKTGAFE